MEILRQGERRILLFSHDGFVQVIVTVTTEEGSPQFVAIICNNKNQKMDYSCNLSDFSSFFASAQRTEIVMELPNKAGADVSTEN